MPRHVIAAVGDIPNGGRLATEIKGRPIVVFNCDGQYFALLDRCPHAGARLSQGLLTGLVEAEKPGCFKYSRPGEFIKCPWHGWEFDVRSGQSYCNPQTVKTRTYEVEVHSGCDLEKGPFVAESFDISIEDNYIVIDI